MFAGHVAAGLVIARADRRLNAGTLVVAALGLDLVLWMFVLLGWETVTIPADFENHHQAAFIFPYSHGLLAALGWSVAAGAVTAWALPAPGAQRTRAAIVVGAAVFSHWVLDVLVHVPELPLAGPDSIKLGLGLWNLLPAGLGLEAVLVLAAVALVASEPTLSRARRMGLIVLCLMLLSFTVAGLTVAPAPPSANAMAGSSLVMLVLVCAAIVWLDSARVARAAA